MTKGSSFVTVFGIVAEKSPSALRDRSLTHVLKGTMSQHTHAHHRKHHIQLMARTLTLCSTKSRRTDSTCGGWHLLARCRAGAGSRPHAADRLAVPCGPTRR
jgi:hypothetical protein